MRTAALLLFAIAVAGGEAIDRVAAVVGRDVITESDVGREARLEAFRPQNFLL